MALYELSDEDVEGIQYLIRLESQKAEPDLPMLLRKDIRSALSDPVDAPATEEMNPLYAALLDRDEATTVNVPMTKAELAILARAVANFIAENEECGGGNSPAMSLLVCGSAATKVLEDRS